MMSWGQVGPVLRGGICMSRAEAAQHAHSALGITAASNSILESEAEQVTIQLMECSASNAWNAAHVPNACFVPYILLS